MGCKGCLRRGFHSRRISQVQDMGADLVGLPKPRGGCLGSGFIHIPNGNGSPPAGS
jgi:hypothetical protein